MKILEVRDAPRPKLQAPAEGRWPSATWGLRPHLSITCVDHPCQSPTSITRVNHPVTHTALLQVKLLDWHPRQSPDEFGVGVVVGVRRTTGILRV